MKTTARAHPDIISDCAAIVLACLGVLCICGCGAGKQVIVREPSNPAPPSWLKSIPVEEGYLYAVGSGSKAATLQEGRAAARASAASQLASYIEVAVDSRFSATSSVGRGGDDLSASDTTSTRSRALLKDMEVVDEFYVRTTRQAGRLYEEHFDVDLLCRYLKAHAAEERDRIKEQARIQIIDSYEGYNRANGEISAGRHLAARAIIESSLGVLADMADSDPLPGPGPGGFGNDVRGLKNALSSLRDRLATMSSSARVRVIPRGAASACGPDLERMVGEALGEAGISCGDHGRYEVTVDINQPALGGFVMGRQSATTSYSWEIRDTWKERRTSGTGSGAVRGFARDANSALTEAARAAARDAGKAAGASFSSIKP